MQTQINQILDETGTKTAKIRKLILLGLTRRQIANLVTNNNYGFVQNVYAKMREEGILNTAITQSFNAPFNRKFGVEFEACNVSKTVLRNKLTAAGINCENENYNHNTRHYWKIINDSSLLGSQTFELVSPILYGENGLIEVKTVCRVLNECGAKVNKSCGTHVHFDAAGFNLQLWKNIYKNYAKIEHIIDGFMPWSRKANNNCYCKSVNSIIDIQNKIDNANSLLEIEDIFSYSRYYKINPLSYSRHNTIEFRQHSGTVEFEKISNWIYFLNNLVAKSNTGLIENTTLAGLESFNNIELVNYFKQRTIKLS